MELSRGCRRPSATENEAKRNVKYCETKITRRGRGSVVDYYRVVSWNDSGLDAAGQRAVRRRCNVLWHSITDDYQMQVWLTDWLTAVRCQLLQLLLVLACAQADAALPPADVTPALPTYLGRMFILLVAAVSALSECWCSDVYEWGSRCSWTTGCGTSFLLVNSPHHSLVELSSCVSGNRVKNPQLADCLSDNFCTWNTWNQCISSTIWL